MDAFLQRVLALTAEHGGLEITSAEKSAAELALQVRLFDQDGACESWQVVARDVREHRLELNWTDVVTFADDHPLLWPHLDEQAQLFFSTRPNDPFSTVGRLYERHRRDTQGWHPFDRFLNAEMPVGRLLDAGAGLLAAGPVRLLTAYGEVLAEDAVVFSIVGNRPAKYWKRDSDELMAGGAWIVEDKALKVLSMGDSYIVGGEFDARS